MCGVSKIYCAFISSTSYKQMVYQSELLPYFSRAAHLSVCFAISNKFCYPLLCSDTVVLVEAFCSISWYELLLWILLGCAGAAGPACVGVLPGEEEPPAGAAQSSLGLLGSLGFIDQNTPWKFLSWNTYQS